MKITVQEKAHPSRPIQKNKNEFASDQTVRWCPGCGDYAILSSVQKIMPELGVPRENIVFLFTFLIVEKDSSSIVLTWPSKIISGL